MDIGLYRVSWQSYGKDPVRMPLSWTGHFDEQTGVSYARWGRVLGREALLIHSPWRVPPGQTWVDYQLALPQVTPIRLSFSIAMGPDVATPDKSDGVTFSSELLADGQARNLMRRHWDQGQWLDYSFDLSPYAGKTVTLRLQVEPGPRNNASFDYSFFGDPKVTAGGNLEVQSEVVKRLTGRRASKATAAASLVALSNNPTNGVTPANLLPCTNRLEQAGRVWRFIYDGPDCRIDYLFEPVTGTLDDFSAQVDDARPFQPARGGGATAAVKTGDKTVQIPLRGGRPTSVSARDHTLTVVWEHTVQGAPLRVTWDFTIVGKSLVASARCDSPRISAFSLGEVAAPLRKTFNVPYLLGQVHYLPVQGVFVSRYLDWTRSQSSQCPQGVATYDPKSDGTRNTLFETGYIAVSPEVNEVLPNIPHPPSPFLATLGPCVMLDIWGHHQGTYAGDAEHLRELKDHGVDHLVIIQHDWQRYGYDAKLPDHLPANPAYGGEEGMKAFGKAAIDCGYLWSLHENYIDLYPDAPSYDPAARVLHADGSPSKAWYNPGTKVQSFGLKCNRALGFAKENSPEAHRRYATTAAYLDVHTCVPPWHQLDHEAAQPMAAMQQAKVKFDTELFQFERDTHGGPLFGEGANHFFWAGRCDGVEAQVAGGEDHAAFLDFDLLKLHPQMVNHGMGYYERWYRRGYDAAWGVDAGSPESFDKYRAQELAYGHAGFIGNALVANVQHVWREHSLMHPAQRLYGAARPAEIRYEVDGQFVGASAALVAGETSRQLIRYQSGLTLWVNWRKEPWQVEVNRQEAEGRGQSQVVRLPQWGFVGVGPDTEVSTSLRGERIADYAVCPEYVFADARTHFDLPYLRARKDIEPRLREARYLGSNRVEVTYEWLVNDTLDADYQCFVHGINAGEFWGDHIVFQGDHAVPRPTREWRPGQTIVDGPHLLRVSDKYDSYDLVIGLHRGGRVPLKGVQEAGHRILVAHLKLEKRNGQIANVAVEKLMPENLRTSSVASRYADRAAEEADFAAHTNPTGTMIDFGLVTTDGALKINRERERLVIFPYPRGKSFRASLDLKGLTPAADPATARVRALAAGTLRDLGPVAAAVENSRLVLTLGTPDAGRYEVTWR
jgi:hypothetical protein